MTLSLERMRRGVPIVSSAGMPTESYALMDEKRIRQLEAVVNAQGDLIAQILAAQAAADAANAAATAANAAAEAAQASADSVGVVAEDLSLQNSYATGLTVTATDAGASVTISISAHTRVYGDGTSVAVNAGSLTGIPYSVNRWVYYDQASRAGGAVTYIAATSAQAQTGDRHVVGAVATPASGAPPSDGNPIRAPGYLEP
jgi:hypothetical protein